MRLEQRCILPSARTAVSRVSDARWACAAKLKTIARRYSLRLGPMLSGKANSSGNNATPVQFMQLLTSVLTCLETLKHPSLTVGTNGQGDAAEGDISPPGSTGKAARQVTRFSGAKALIPRAKQPSAPPRYPAQRPSSLIGGHSGRSDALYTAGSLRNSVSDNGGPSAGAARL